MNDPAERLGRDTLRRFATQRAGWLLNTPTAAHPSAHCPAATGAIQHIDALLSPPARSHRRWLVRQATGRKLQVTFRLSVLYPDLERELGLSPGQLSASVWLSQLVFDHPSSDLWFSAHALRRPSSFQAVADVLACCAVPWLNGHAYPSRNGRFTAASFASEQASQMVLARANR